MTQIHTSVVAELVPATPIIEAPRENYRGGRDKLGHDNYKGGSIWPESAGKDLRSKIGDIHDTE
jgi:hypothetical protein